MDNSEALRENKVKEDCAKSKKEGVMHAKSKMGFFRSALMLFCLFTFATPIFAAELPTVVVIATGGTIACMPDPKTGALVPAKTGEELVKAVPEINALAKIEFIQFINIPSPTITPQHMLDLSKLVNKTLDNSKVSGVVITHGTSTIEETAYFLDLTVKSEKPVVLTGAMRSPNQISPDGPVNLLNAVRQAVSKEAIGKGVTVTLNSRISPARNVMKTDTSNVSTFQGGDYGYLGIADIDKIVFFHQSLRRQTLPLPEELARVDLILMYTGADGSYVKFAVDSGAKGIVVAGFGLGEVNGPMAEGIKYALEKGIPVVISTRVHKGRIVPLYGGPGGGVTLKDLGCVFSDDLSPWKARILLMLALSITKDRKDLQAFFDK